MISSYLSVVTQTFNVFEQVESLSQVNEVKKENVLCTAIGIEALGRLGNLLIENAVRDNKRPEFLEITKFFDLPPNKKEKKEIEEFKKSSGNDFDRYITKRHGSKQKHRQKKSLVILGDKWFFETKGKLVIDGEKSKTHGLKTLLNDRVIYITSQCFSRKTCKNIDQLMLKIIGPTFSLEITKIKKFDTSNKKEMIKMFNTVKNGYRYYKLAKFLIMLL